MPFCEAHSARGTVAWGSVKLVLTRKGEASVMVEVAAAMTTAGTLACVASGAEASASGVRPKPAMTAAFSLTISSCASRFVMSATPVSSRTTSSIFRPATESPFRRM
jgi:hypothetical protein